MKIRDLLNEKSILLDVTLNSKNEAIEKAVELMSTNGNINNIEEFKKAVFLREEEGSTGVGEGVAIPHGKGDSVSFPAMAAMAIPEGVDYDSIDGEPATLLFLIAAPNTKDNVHLDVLAKFSTFLIDEEFTKRLREAKTTKEFLAIIDEYDEKESDVSDESDVKITDDEKFILAVTSCPTGIAHTYMAAESLSKAATAIGAKMKVETRGSGGAKNVLTDEEIMKADGIIVAANTNVPMDRFDGKPVVECQVADGIHKADELVQTIVQGKAQIYTAKNAPVKSKGQGSVGSRIYNQLMSGLT